jgi:hypothetical protein
MNRQFSTNAVCGVCKQSYKLQPLLFDGGLAIDFIESPSRRLVKSHAHHNFGANSHKVGLAAWKAHV